MCLSHQPIKSVMRWMLLLLTIISSKMPVAAQGDVLNSSANSKFELNDGWVCKKASEMKSDKPGEISGWKLSDQKLKDWLPATVPGTVLTTLLNNDLIPDPFYGMNNKKIPDIYDIGKEEYTYWFVKDFQQNAVTKGQQIWLHFRGVNYGFDVYLNGVKLNKQIQRGMFMRRHFNITKLLSKSGRNRLAVLVYPPDVVGEANGGQGGDGTIARNVGHQYVAGWDWIQPIHDRNTGIWDKVWLEKTGPIILKDAHVTTIVPGRRSPDENEQAPAFVYSQISINNNGNQSIKGKVHFEIGGHTASVDIKVDANTTQRIDFPVDTLTQPKLWWPNGMGPEGDRFLYPAKFTFTLAGGQLSDADSLQVGVRQIGTRWNNHTRSMEVLVNGQPVFIRGGNWIVSDAMLRFSDARYDAEVRFHRDMRLNLIRVWGGALTERPEFYQACDKYGLLVMQDFWGSGDCNGRWEDPKKKDDIWTRRGYPDDHGLFLASAADQIRMLRNHASLAIWCGGNEITLPSDLQDGLRDSLLPLLDTTRWYIDFSNSDSMSFNSLGGNGDGPYGLQPIERFWSHRTYPFNSEVGSVGIGDSVSLARFLPPENQVVPVKRQSTSGQKGQNEKTVDSVWDYHKYIGYGSSIKRYGEPKTMSEFANIAQLVNYNQYRALMEGFTGHQWDWYTGFIIWKTQNPWTALRGQMYDYYLDPNAGLYGLRKGGERVHLMFNPADNGVYILNNGYGTARNMMLEVKACTMEGKVTLLTRTITQAVAQHPKLLLSMRQALEKLSAEKGMLLSLRLLDLQKNIISENVYWLPDEKDQYSGLANMPGSKLKAKAHWEKIAAGKRRIAVVLSNPIDAPPAFFNRLSLVDDENKQRILPTFYSENYVTLFPGTNKTIYIDSPNITNNEENGAKQKAISIEGWNLPLKLITIE